MHDNRHKDKLVNFNNRKTKGNTQMKPKYYIYIYYKYTYQQKYTERPIYYKDLMFKITLIFEIE